MKNPLFKNTTGKYDGIKIYTLFWKLIDFWTLGIIRRYLWAKRNKKAFFKWAKALKENPNTPSILLK